jgi:DNA-binding SARP family transcriptional activator/predicted ATPase
MTRLVVRLLGGYRVELDGEAVYGFETDKARALLAFLVVEADRPHRREALASLLWPDRPESAARTNLRQALASVRRALADYEPPFFIFANPTDIQFNTASDYTLDVAELAAIASAPGRQPELLPEAFCTDFLAGFAVPDSEVFQEWVLNRQEHYHRLVLEILEDQNAAFESAGDYEQAVAAARRQLQMEPWLEEAHRRCMRGLALAGRRDEALHQFELCRVAMQTELGDEPAASTRELYADIRAGRLAARVSGTGQPPTGQPQGLPLQGRGGSGTRPGLRSQPPAGPPARLVARADEFGQLGGHLDAALAGEPTVVFVSGDAGSGKTALLEAFAASAMAERPDLLVAGARCDPGGSLDAFAPLHRLAEMLFGNLASHAAWRLHGRDQADRLQDATGLALAALAEHGAGLVGTLVPVVSVARRGRRPSAPPGTALSQGALFDQLLCTLAAIARERPLLLLLDDLHWVDDATTAFLVHLGRQLSDSPILVLGAYRSATVALGRRDPRSGATIRHPLAVAVNELRRTRGEILVELDRADGRAFVEAYVDTEPNRLGAPFRDALYAQTGGHALFTVETLRNLQERGELVKDEAGRWIARESLDWGRLPIRVEAAIAERVDRLPEAERQILSAASVQGEIFSAEAVAELTGGRVAEVLTCLSESLARQHHLVRPEGLDRVEGFGRGRHFVYRFTHHLFQKYLYDQLDPVERAQWHAVIAATLDRQVGADLALRERLAARLAWHYEAGGLPLQAARALLDAGRQATRVSAFREALNLFDHGLALLHGVDAARPAASASVEPERAPAEQGLAEHGPREQGKIEQLLQIARLVPQRSLSGTGATEQEGALAQVIEAGAGELEDRTKLAALTAEASNLIARGQFPEVLQIAQRMLDLATRCGDEAFEALAHFWFGFIYHFLGEPRKADGYLEWVLARHRPGRWAELRALVGLDLLPHSLTISAINKLSLGYPDEALARSARAVTAAQDLGDHIGLAFASAIGSMTLFLLRSDPQALQERAELCCRHCEKHGFAWWQYYAATFLGWLVVVGGEPDEGIERMHSAIVAWQATGMALGMDSLDIVLADAYLEAVRRDSEGNNRLGNAGRIGLLTEGLARINAVLGPNNLCGQCYQAELYRMRGELLTARDGLAAAVEALACFNRALALGREKGALSWELRAAMSLVRLRSRQGRAYEAELAEARRYLAEVYARFTEGFGSPDLRDAAALIGDYPLGLRKE